MFPIRKTNMKSLHNNVNQRFIYYFETATKYCAIFLFDNWAGFPDIKADEYEFLENFNSFLLRPGIVFIFQNQSWLTAPNEYSS